MAFLAVSFNFTDEIESFFDLDWFDSLLIAFPGTIFSMLSLQALLLTVYGLILIPNANSRFHSHRNRLDSGATELSVDGRVQEAEKPDRGEQYVPPKSDRAGG